MGAADLFGKDPRASYTLLVAKNLPADAGDARDAGSIPGSPGGGRDSPLQCSCLENPMDRGAWRAAVHGVTEGRTRLRRLSRTHAPGEATPERAREVEEEREVAQRRPQGPAERRRGTRPGIPAEGGELGSFLQSPFLEGGSLGALLLWPVTPG